MRVWLPLSNRSADHPPSVTSRLGYFFRAVSEWIDLTYTAHLQGRPLVYLTQQLKGLCLKIVMFEHASQRGLGFCNRPFAVDAKSNGSLQSKIQHSAVCASISPLFHPFTTVHVG
jgi:hypothetical protein